MPVTLFWREFFRGRNARVARMWARLSLKSQSMAFDPRAGTQPYTTSATFNKERAGLRPGGKDTPQRDSPKREPQTAGYSGETILGFAGLASHSGRFPNSIPSYVFWRRGPSVSQEPTKVPDQSVSIGMSWVCVKRKVTRGGKRIPRDFRSP